MSPHQRAGLPRPDRRVVVAALAVLLLPAVGVVALTGGWRDEALPTRDLPLATWSTTSEPPVWTSQLGAPASGPPTSTTPPAEGPGATGPAPSSSIPTVTAPPVSPSTVGGTRPAPRPRGTEAPGPTTSAPRPPAPRPTSTRPPVPTVPGPSPSPSGPCFLLVIC